MTSRGTTGIDDPSGATVVTMGKYAWTSGTLWTVRYDGLKNSSVVTGAWNKKAMLTILGAIAPAPDRYMTLGARHDSGTSFSQRGNWEIGEVIFFDRAVSDDELRICWKIILQSKWNIPFLDTSPPASWLNSLTSQRCSRGLSMSPSTGDFGWR